MPHDKLAPRRPIKRIRNRRKRKNFIEKTPPHVDFCFPTTDDIKDYVLEVFDESFSDETNVQRDFEMTTLGMQQNTISNDTLQKDLEREIDLRLITERELTKLKTESSAVTRLSSSVKNASQVLLQICSMLDTFLGTKSSNSTSSIQHDILGEALQIKLNIRKTIAAWEEEKKNSSIRESDRIKQSIDSIEELKCLVCEAQKKSDQLTDQLTIALEEKGTLQSLLEEKEIAYYKKIEELSLDNKSLEERCASAEFNFENIKEKVAAQKKLLKQQIGKSEEHFERIRSMAIKVCTSQQAARRATKLLNLERELHKNDFANFTKLQLEKENLCKLKMAQDVELASLRRKVSSSISSSESKALIAKLAADRNRAMLDLENVKIQENRWKALCEQRVAESDSLRNEVKLLNNELHSLKEVSVKRLKEECADDPDMPQINKSVIFNMDPANEETKQILAQFRQLREQEGKRDRIMYLENQRSELMENVRQLQKQVGLLQSDLTVAKSGVKIPTLTIPIQSTPNLDMPSVTLGKNQLVPLCTENDSSESEFNSKSSVRRKMEYLLQKGNTYTIPDAWSERKDIDILQNFSGLKAFINEYKPLK